MGRILITTDYLVPGDDVDRFLRERGHETTHSPASGARSDSERAALFDGVDGAIIASEPVTGDMLAGAQQLKVLARSGVGYDSIDVSAATEAGVRVCNAPGTNHHSVAEMTIGLLIMSARHLGEVTRAVRAGQWPREAGHELHGATLGLVGYGPSGQATAQLGLALGMRVMVATSHPDADAAAVEFAPLEEVIVSADYLSLHSRADKSGAPMINAPHLSTMKSSAVLINTARGSLVDERALSEAVTSGTIAGAALDVLEDEPISADNPLQGLDNVLITSHLAGQTVEARARAAMVAARGVVDVLDGREPAHPVDR